MLDDLLSDSNENALSHVYDFILINLLLFFLLTVDLLLVFTLALVLALACRPRLEGRAIRMQDKVHSQGHTNW